MVFSSEQASVEENSNNSLKEPIRFATSAILSLGSVCLRRYGVFRASFPAKNTSPQPRPS
jgi:hypothetical protein